MLSPRAIALQGIGFGALSVATQGFVSVGVTPPDLVDPVLDVYRPISTQLFNHPTGNTASLIYHRIARRRNK